mmetsp:Transcript_29307/g.82684  ORF Transcript_29307/g.82684 Transcript_29307/m.82684 type:complete len:257 (-) Transcript_29307:693-1463(-)
MIHHCVHHTVRKGVFLLQQLEQKIRVGSRILHLCDPHHGGCRMEYWDRHPLEYRRDNDCLPQSTVACLAERQQKALVEGTRLVCCLPHGLEKSKVQTLVLTDVVSDAWKKHQRQKPLGHLGVQVGDKDAGRLIAGVHTPFIWLREIQDLLPVAQFWQDFESLWDLPCTVALQQLPNPLVHVNYLGVQTTWDQHLAVITRHCTLCSTFCCLLLPDLAHDDVSQGPRRLGIGSHELLECLLILLSDLYFLHIPLAFSV